MKTLEDLIYDNLEVSDIEKLDQLSELIKDVEDILYFEKGNYEDPNVIEAIKESKNQFYSIKKELYLLDNNYLNLEIGRLEARLLKSLDKVLVHV